MSELPELSRLLNLGVLNEVDLQLAQLMERLDGSLSREVTLALALASQWPQRGHVCLDLHALAVDDLWNHQETPPRLAGMTLPEPDEWSMALQACDGVGGPEDRTPFVLWQ